MKSWLSYDFNDMRLEEAPMPVAELGRVVCRTRVLRLSVAEVAESSGLVSDRPRDRIIRRLTG